MIKIVILTFNVNIKGDKKITKKIYNIMNKFSVAEMKGRNLWNEKLIKNNSTNVKFTPSKFDKVDVFWEKDGKKYVGEIKFREKYSSKSKIVEDGLMLEKIKYDELKRYQAMGYTPYYINFMNDGNIFLFDLTNNECPKWVEEIDKYPQDSQYNQDKKVTKVVTYLTVDKAIKCKYNKKESL